MSRFRASFIHLLISALLVGVVFAIVFWVWYPKPAFEIAGALNIVFLLVAVDLVLGPLLTLVVYKSGKPGLKFDLSVIAFVQLVALTYGAYTLFEERPFYMVFAVDRLEFVPKKQVDQSEIRFDELADKRLTELIRVFARSPEDPEEFQRYLDSVMFGGEPDLERRAEYWEPWSAGADVIREKIQPVENFAAESEREQRLLKNAIAKFQIAHPNLGLLPIGGIQTDMSMLIDRDSLRPIDAIKVDAW